MGLRLGRLRRADAALGLVLLVLAAGVYVAARSFPPPKAEPLGPAFFPQLLAGLLVVLAAILTARGAFGPPGGVPEPRATPAYPAGVLALRVGYAALLHFAGFLVATPVFLFAVVRLLGARASIAAWTAVAVTAAVYLVFQLGLDVRLPDGALW